MPFIDIVPVGPAGAGKSCLLAAMKQGLERWESAPAPSLRPDPVTALVLEETWRSMRAGGIGHPVRGDRRALVDLWFEAVSEGAEPLFEARLLDYDGNAAMDRRHPVGRAVAARVRRADALLCLLDGARIAALLDGDRDGCARDMAEVWKLVAARGRPVRFVVTKWDLLEHRTSLAQVRAALLGLPGFVTMLRRLSARPGGTGSAALVPVSVVGDDAARQSLVPLLSVLPRVLRAAAGRAERTARRGGSLAAGVGVNWVSQAVTAVAVRQVLQHVVDTVPEHRDARRYAAHAAVGVSILAEAAVRTWCDRAVRRADGERPRADATPLTRAADAYEWQLRDFRDRFPAADLSHVVSPAPRLLRRHIVG